MDDYILYQSFVEITDARALSELLKEANVAHLIRQTDQNATTYLNNHSGDRYQIMVRESQMKEADKVFLESNQDVDISEHPFQEMSDVELIDVLMKKEEWNVLEVDVAKKILVARGNKITDQDIRKWELSEIKKTGHEKQGELLWYVFALICALPMVFSWALPKGWLFYFLSFISLTIARYYARNKTILPTGEKVYTYDKKTRHIGQAIMGLTGAFYFINLAILLFFK